MPEWSLQSVISHSFSATCSMGTPALCVDSPSYVAAAAVFCTPWLHSWRGCGFFPVSGEWWQRSPGQSIFMRDEIKARIHVSHFACFGGAEVMEVSLWTCRVARGANEPIGLMALSLHFLIRWPTLVILAFSKVGMDKTLANKWYNISDDSISLYSCGLI